MTGVLANKNDADDEARRCDDVHGIALDASLWDPRGVPISTSRHNSHYMPCMPAASHHPISQRLATPPSCDDDGRVA